jgi:cell division protein FtsQ
MAGDYIYSAGETASGTRFEKILKFFIILAVIGLGAELIWLLGITPFRPFSRVDISGCEEIDRGELLALAGLTGNSTYFSTNERIVEKALLGFSYFESVKVFKLYPDRIRIVLEARRAVASAYALIDGKTVPVYFDSQGVIFRIGGISRALPVISGLVIEEPFPGMRLPVTFSPLFREIEKIEASAPELLEAVSEIRINRRSSNLYDIVLFPVHRRIRVRLPELNEDLLRYTLLMVDVLASKESGIENLDFRSGIASYIPKEASSE